jgi:hypothetical protein
MLCRSCLNDNRIVIVGWLQIKRVKLNDEITQISIPCVDDLDATLHIGSRPVVCDRTADPSEPEATFPPTKFAVIRTCIRKWGNDIALKKK